MLVFFQTHTTILYIYAFVVGATITSFICLAAERLPHQLRWRDEFKRNYTICSPPSSCNECEQRIPFMFLVPLVGYLACGGRCVHCGFKIPIRYPLIELFGGVGTVFCFYYFGIGLLGGEAGCLFLILLFLSIIDIYEHWLPAIVTYPLFWCGLLFSSFCIDLNMRVIGAALGFYTLYCAMFLLSLWKKEDLFAGGDIALATAAGAWLGIENMPMFFMITSLSYIIYGLPMRLKGYRFSPMGPALAIGFMFCLL
ncbi:TPA: prepilin peptidase [Escherichia coli]|nr:prepilin peptidase [Escherichia coli]HBA7007085.1 prepilin peptidase [Escherichia coli]HBA7959027.1 prepilin peptidase [Escherichia coli]HBA8246094.1 prepilin peptidase [Escherichia coli]HBA8543690.1 prepilin peptidase [Escherichia coli]